MISTLNRLSDALLFSSADLDREYLGRTDFITYTALNAEILVYGMNFLPFSTDRINRAIL
jgi:hypothetical protein